MTFFVQAKHTFLAVPDDEKILTEPFLAAASEVVPFFDVLGPTAFKPVKSDINGNIKKLRTKFETDKEKYSTLQGMVESEIAEGTTQAKNSATDALLWLKRALQFIRVFLDEVLKGEEDLNKCASKAYEASLKRFHGWLVRGIFSLAMKAVPYRKDFIKALLQGAEGGEERVLADMKEFMKHFSQNVDTLTRYYIQSGQETDKTV
ncbi:glycolipid transfer protein-like isoform X2 [Oscarella lobularis]|uniref:glycolipid transfer protein-like isoform X2 n=1 Tax=Oscarella lobularis TaxID=121494 RepID=UPI003313E24C